MAEKIVEEVWRIEDECMNRRMEDDEDRQIKNREFERMKVYIDMGWMQKDTVIRINIK